MDIKRKKREKRIQLIGGLIGICVAAVSLFYFFHAEKAEAEKRMVEIVNYVKVQCSTYTHYNESSESKSLLRAIESARQMSTNIDMEIENGGHLSQEFLKENLQTLWVDGILVLDAVGKTDCEYSMDESLTGEITAYLQKDIIMDFAGYEERSYSERFTREDGSYIDIAACARKDAPGIVAIYYYTSPEFARNYTLTIQGLLNGYSTQKDGTIIVADEGIVVASNDEKLLGQSTAGSEVVQAMKKHTDSQHIFHMKNEGTGCYGIMLKQRDYYIYAYLPDKEVFHNLPLSVTSVIFLYCLMFSIFWFWTYRTNLAHRKQEFEKDEKGDCRVLKGSLIDSEKTAHVFDGKIMKLNKDTFINDAIIFEKTNSNIVYLKNVKNDRKIEFNYEGFNYMAFWNVPGAEFVCFEPWNGITDFDNCSGKIEEKVGIEKLDAGNTYERAIEITIF